MESNNSFDLIPDDVLVVEIFSKLLHNTTPLLFTCKRFQKLLFFRVSLFDPRWLTVFKNLRNDRNVLLKNNEFLTYKSTTNNIVYNFLVGRIIINFDVKLITPRVPYYIRHEVKNANDDYAIALEETLDSQMAFAEMFVEIWNSEENPFANTVEP